MAAEDDFRIGREIVRQELLDVASRVDMSTSEGARVLVGVAAGMLRAAASAMVASGMGVSETRKTALAATKLGCIEGLSMYDPETVLANIEEFTREV